MTEVTIEAATQLLLALVNNAGAISAAIQAATASGSKTLTVDQWKSITDTDDEARALFVQALGG